MPTASRSARSGAVCWSHAAGHPGWRLRKVFAAATASSRRSSSRARSRTSSAARACSVRCRLRSGRASRRSSSADASSAWRRKPRKRSISAAAWGESSGTVDAFTSVASISRVTEVRWVRASASRSAVRRRRRRRLASAAAAAPPPATPTIPAPNHSSGACHQGRPISSAAASVTSTTVSVHRAARAASWPASRTSRSWSVLSIRSSPTYTPINRLSGSSATITRPSAHFWPSALSQSGCSARARSSTRPLNA